MAFPRPVLPPAVGSCPGGNPESFSPPCLCVSAITGPWGGLGLEKLLGVTRAQVVLVPAPKAVHCSPLSRTGINQAEEKERLPGPCHRCPSHGAQSHTHLSVIHQGQQAWPLHHFPQLKV